MKQNFVPNILIHIGYHKTGSTWLQKELFISESKVFFPLSRKPSGHSTIAEYFFKDPDGYLLSSFDVNYDFIMKELYSILESNKNNSNGKIPVISHERLSGNPHSGGFDASIIAKRLNVIFPDAKILIVIREQNNFIFSNYFQYLVNGGKASLKKYLYTKYDGKRPCFSPNYLNYYLVVKEYFSLYGHNNVLVLPYELLSNSPLLFFDSLGKFLNIKIDLDLNKLKTVWNKGENYYIRYKFRFLNSFRKNNSLNTCYFFSNNFIDYLISMFIYNMNRFIPSSVEKNLINNLKKVVSDFVSNRYVESNLKLSKLINMDLKQFNYF